MAVNIGVIIFALVALVSLALSISFWRKTRAKQREAKKQLEESMHPQEFE